MRGIKFCIMGVAIAALAPAAAFAGPSGMIAPSVTFASSFIERIGDHDYYSRYYRRRYGFYAYGYDPDLSVLGAALATAPSTSLYGYGQAFPAARAYGDPWPYDQPYPFYDYPSVSYGYGYGYPIYGGFRHRYWGPGYPAAGGGPEWARGYVQNGEARGAAPGYRPWGGGFTHRGFDGSIYPPASRRR
jgi:hypothetical protein